MTAAVGAVALTMLQGCLTQGESPQSFAQNQDPVVQDYGIAYIKRAVTDTDQASVLDVQGFHEGGDLYYRNLASPSATERPVSGRFTGGLGDVRDVEVSYDGERLVFSMRAPEIEGAAPEDQPTWNIWEYDIASDALTRVIASDNTAEAGQDLAPHYLPDGRIIFSSTRQRQSKATLLDEGKPQFSALDEDRINHALVLHVMNRDGSDIHQVSFNQSHDLDPTVLSNGQVVFSRWDNMGSQNAINLYRMNPDGTDLQILYGAHSHATGTDNAIVQFLQPRLLPDDRIMAVLKPLTGTVLGGDIITIDTENFIDNTQPTWANRGATGPAQQPATANAVRTDTLPSPGGRFGSVYPLWDGTDRALVTWNECRLLEDERIVPCTSDRLAATDVEEAPPLYGIYLYDLERGTQLPIVRPIEGVAFTEVVVAQPRLLPSIRFDQQAGVELDADAAADGAGILNIRSVYDMDGVDTANPSITALADPARTTADQRAARFLRVEKAVGIPDRNTRVIPGTAYGRSSQQLMREIVAYAPIEPDGSVKIKVPADVPLTISVLDKNGRRTSARHQNWLQLRAGQTLNCVGCHAHASGLPHGRSEGPPSVYFGAPATGVPFINTQSALFTDFGETMAETRTRIDPAALEPSVDLIYADIWTDPVAAGRPADAPFSYLYADLTTPAPVSSDCQTNWTANCRIVINYENHIHPLWSRDRAAATCINCHAPVDAMNNIKVPDAQLDLTDGDSTDQPAHFKSYRELLFNDNEQEVGMGILEDRLIQATDGNGNPLFETDANGNQILDNLGNPIPIMITVGVSASMSTAGANASPRFFSKFDAGGTHAGRLEPAELRLIAEWLDIGAQYYNNPFDVPVN
ncbi:MAG: hypothetical protein KKE76_05150 [Gammaproteobacteria bacterium]|nr:hypothetical protein [Gammaproteobacteria bacterium]